MESINRNIKKWRDILGKGGPRNYYPHSYIVSWYFKNVANNVDGVKNRKVLDIGCGTAPDLFLFVTEGFEYYGIDVTDKCFGEILNIAHKRKLNTGRIHLTTFSPPSIPFKDNDFDVVIGLESLHFNVTRKSMRAIINEVHRMLKPGGCFFLTTINEKHYFTVSEYSRFVSDNCLLIGKGFPEAERAGLKYYVFSGADEIYSFFKDFDEVKVGEYLLDVCDGKPDAYYLIFGKNALPPK